MNNVQIFTNKQFGEIRTIEENGKVLFCGSDVAKALGYARPNDAITAHCKCTVKRRIGVQTGIKSDGEAAVQQIEMLFISEGDVYRLITHSKLPGAEQFEIWVFDEVLPTIRKTGSYSTNAAKPNKSLEIKEINARVRLSNQFLKLSKVDTLSTEYKNILAAKAAEALTGEQIIPPPKSSQKMYSAKEIGQMFGVSAQKIGRISNEHNLKTAEYGEWYRSKSEHSNKEVDTFVYNDKAIKRFKTILM